MKGVWRLGEREIIYLSLHCHHQNDFCIKMGGDESHFNVSVGSDGQSHKTVSSNHNLFEEKREPKRYPTEVLRLTSLTPYLPLRQTVSQLARLPVFGVFNVRTAFDSCDSPLVLYAHRNEKSLYWKLTLG